MSDPRIVLTLPIAQVAIPERRIGYFNKKHADRLAQEIARDGQHDPIHVQNNDNGTWTLVAGLHRLRAVEALDRDDVDAIQVADSTATADDLARLELSENLDHQHRRPIERAIFMARLARIEEDRDHPGRVGESRQARGGRVKAAGVIMSQADWKQRTADALDCSLATLKRYRRIYSNIVEALPGLHERINFHPLCNRFEAVNAIAGRPERERRAVAEMLLSRDDWKSMDAVMAEAGVRTSTGRRDDPHQPDATFLAALGKMKGPRRRTTLLTLADKITPSEVLEMVEVFKKRRIVGEVLKVV